MGKKLLEVTASEIVRSSMEIYAKEVIEDRSLPDFRDGLKISQRRILYYMWSEGLVATGNFKASANVVGGVLGKLHAHGDISIFETLVRLNSNIISPVNGDGSWGDIHTEAAAMRYTKTKLSDFGDRFCQDIPVSDWISTYSGEWQEPIIIPSPIPYALLAGTSGIAVAVATSIPSHNLTELVQTFINVLHGEQDIDKLIGVTLLGPESKTGGIIVSSLDEIRDMYLKGKGKVKWRCDYTVVYDKRNDEWSLIITGIPEAFPLDGWLTKMKAHAQVGMLQIENESCANDPIRYVVTFNNVAFFHDVIEPSLYCTDSYSFNLIAKAGERAVDISLQHHSLLSWIDAWLTWREEVEIQIVKAQIEKLDNDLYRESTKFWASENIDDIIAALKQSQHPVQDLKTKFNLEDSQAKIIAEMQLQAISKLSKDKQDKAIRGLTSEMLAENKKLTQPKLLIENTLRSLLKYDKGRIAKIDYGDGEVGKVKKSLKKSDGKPNYWAIETSKPKSLHQIGSELSLRKRVMTPYLGIVNAQTGIVTVTEKGEVKRWNLSELNEKDMSATYVSILSPEYQQIVIALSNGLWGNYWMEQKVASWTTKLIHAGEDKVLSAVGINKGDLLWVYFDNGTLTDIESVFCTWEPFTRANKKGWKGKGKQLRLLAIPKGYTLVIDAMHYSFQDLIRPVKGLVYRFFKAKSYYLYDPTDDKCNLLCIAQDGTRSLMTGKEIASCTSDLIQTYLI